MPAPAMGEFLWLVISYHGWYLHHTMVGEFSTFCWRQIFWLSIEEKHLKDPTVIGKQTWNLKPKCILLANTNNASSGATRTWTWTQTCDSLTACIALDLGLAHCCLSSMSHDRDHIVRQLNIKLGIYLNLDHFLGNNRHRLHLCTILTQWLTLVCKRFFNSLSFKS